MVLFSRISNGKLFLSNNSLFIHNMSVISTHKVSIITPCFNSMNYIERTLVSVQAQTLSNWEYVVVDDGSTDGSAAVIEGYLDDEPRLQLVMQENSGCAHARNSGFVHSSSQSEYLLFLDADDCLEPEMLETICSYMDAHSEVGMTYCQYTLIDMDDRLISAREAGLTTGPRLAPYGMGIRALKAEEVRTPLTSIFTLTAGIIPSLAVFRRSVYEKTPGWDEEMSILYEDVGLYIHIALRSEVHFISQPLVRYRRHSAQSTDAGKGREREAMQQAKLYAKWNQLTGLPPEQQAMLNEARAFREGRIVPFAGFHTGAASLRSGQWGKAIRFYGGAIRRYAASFRGQA